ncbi:hypothetical protein [Gallibacterium salpingitidis]|uniref:Uncharacterized protein n=1 Tax=Gallibacterium salpingitidis TaxID=505341 RepID=A0A1A7NS04_9PAST|nr:hypothetical protein [Gallibacterium salpingitidis]OBW93007.1 hypothetical protein QS62_08065 [Gallibacterium salpingitidis]
MRNNHKTKIEFNFSLKIDEKEKLTRKVAFEGDTTRGEVLAVQIIKQLENAKLDAEFDYIYNELMGSTT